MNSLLNPPAPPCETSEVVSVEADLLAAIIDAMARGGPLSPVLPSLIGGLVALSDALAGQLWSADSGGTARREASAGPRFPVDAPLSAGDHLLQPWIQHDLPRTAAPDVCEWADRHGIDTAVAVPVRSGRHDLGRLEMCWPQPVGIAHAERLWEWGRRIALLLVQDRLAAMEELALGLLQLTPAATIESDLQGRVRLWNPAARRMLGWHDSEVLGRTTRVVPTEARAEFDRQLAQIQLGRTVQEHATVRQRNDGSILDVVSSSVPLYTATGEVRGVLEVVSDRSEQCRQARQTQALLRVQQILADSPVLDAALPAVLQTIGTLVACDRTELWVRTPADGPLQLAGTWCANPSPARTAGAVVSPSAPASNKELPEAVARARTILFWPAAGPHGWTPQQVSGPTSAAVGVPVMDRQQVIAVLGLHGPDLKELDAGLRQRVQSVALAVAQFLARRHCETELAETSARLRQAQKMDALGLLTGGIAHDFNNVLTVILSYSELAGDEVGTGHPAYDMLSEIHNAGQRAAAMTRRLLSFSRQRDEGPVLIDVNDLVADLERMLRRLIGPGVQLESRLVPGIGVVRADAGQIEQVLVNLVVNARDAMPAGGRITLSTCGVTLRSAELRRYPGARSGDYVAVTVSDTGCGMEESTRARIFEPFFTTKAPGSGTGMGLATVAAIVRQCGGFIDVETAVGRGTAMHVFLPRARETLATQFVDEGPPTPPAGGTETILLIEDDPTIRTLIRRIIQVRGYHVLEAADGDEALRLLSEVPQTVSLVLTSPEAARMAHAAFTNRLNAVSPATRVMLLVDSADDRRASGSDHDPEVLQKPFTSDDLARRIRVVLDERAG